MKAIEKLVIWLIPAEILGAILHAVFTWFSAWNRIEHSFSALTVTFSLLSSLSYLVGYAVIGIWLFQQSRQSSSRRWIWLVFGCSTGYWALGIYLLIQIPAISEQLRCSQPEQPPAA